MHASKADKAFRAEVVQNRRVDDHHRLLEIRPINGAPPKPRAGQFYMVSAGGSSLDPLLKRPFCYFDTSPSGNPRMLYKIAGRGTAILSQTPVGSQIDVLGPLGNYYPMPSKDETPVIVAGGVGVASIYPLVKALEGRAIVVYGARTAEQLVLFDELRAMSAAIHGCTDDGCFGIKGTAMDALKQLSVEGNIHLYACGPTPMLKAIIAFARERGIKGHASLEEHMACGIGACMGCVTPTTKGYRRVCHEGPVFPLDILP